MAFRSLALVPVLWLAACGGEEARIVRPEGDPAMTLALNAPLMTDPDLVALNGASHAALLPDGDGSIPVEDSSPQAISAARAEALALVGGPGRMEAAPKPQETAGEAASGAMLAAAARAAAAPAVAAACVGAATYTAAWAARMPETFPIYPRGAAHEAAGADGGGCALRSISFATPVPGGEVIDFYYTRASRAGYDVRHVSSRREVNLEGRKGESGFWVRVRQRGDGMTAVDLVTSGA